MITIPNTRRFFVSPDTVANGETVMLTEAEVMHQMSRVLRLQPGDHVLLLDGQGLAYPVELTQVGRNQINGRILAVSPASGEPVRYALTLYVSLLRAERFEWVLQKGTELGVTQFVPVVWSRTQATGKTHKYPRWHKIIREAAEQSCRGKLPILAEPMDVAIAYQQAQPSPLSLLLWEHPTAQGQPTPTMREIIRQHIACPAPPASPDPIPMAIFSGPEGGITDNELTTAKEHGIIPVSLGPRILRAETAPIAATAAIIYELEG